MATNYPGAPDQFNEPTEPEGTPLSEAGTGNRNHFEHHRDLGDAVEAIEANASLKGHDHSGDPDEEADIEHGNKLDQANTHENADTDTAVAAIHHTLGKTALTAAPGNHVHSYNDLLDRPYIVCTTLTRPSNPFVGMMIFETDTSTFRIWASFPTNPEATGVIVSDDFHRDVDYSLGNALWDQWYFHEIDYGFFFIYRYPWPGTPVYYSAWWMSQLTESNWCIARRCNSDDEHTESDEQEITVTWGDHDFDHHHSYGEDAPCNDHYFHMSDDKLHYARVAIFYGWIVVSYSHNGPDEEVVLGTLFCPVWEPNLTWTILGATDGFYVYRNGVYIGTVTDHGHFHSVGSGYRGWGIGTHVVGHSGGQYRAPDIRECKIRDRTSYAPVSRWGLLPVASVPILIAESQARQQIPPQMEMVLVFGNIVYDWVYGPMMLESDTDIHITEPGVYHVHASIAWDPGYTYQDHSMIGVKVNGQDIGRKNWEFIRGGMGSPWGYSPGFSQTTEINFWWRFNAGDRVNVIARHNGEYASYTWYDLNAPDHQVCHVELAYHSP